jgi:hypothetical protein
LGSFEGVGGEFVMVGPPGRSESRTYVSLLALPWFPAASVARTLKVYEPSGWLERSAVNGLVQDPYGLRIVPPRASSHSTEDPASVEKLQLGLLSLPGLAGARVIVGGAGGVESSMYVTALIEQAEVRP